MAESKNEDIVEIVREVWPTKFQIVGKGTVRRLVENAAGSESARSGDKIDVASTLEAIKAAIELVASGITLYAAVRDAKKTRSEVDAEFELKLHEAENSRQLTAEQASKLRELISDRA